MKDFINFVRKQGVMGLAIGFILGGAVNGVINSFVKDVLQPILSALVGTESILSLHFKEVMYGRFLVSVMDFLILALVVYFVFKKMKLDRLDLSEEEKN